MVANLLLMQLAAVRKNQRSSTLSEGCQERKFPHMDLFALRTKRSEAETPGIDDENGEGCVNAKIRELRSRAKAINGFDSSQEPWPRREESQIHVEMNSPMLGKAKQGVEMLHNVDVFIVLVWRRAALSPARDRAPSTRSVCLRSWYLKLDENIKDLLFLIRPHAY